MRRPGDVEATRESRPVARRAPRASALRSLIAVDRASVRRAPALRPGGFVLAVLPGLAATGAQVPFQSLVVMPGLVDAGTGLLFGIIAFSLDGSSALFVATLPRDPRLVAWSKLLVLAEVTLGAVVITTVPARCGARATCGDRGCRHPRQWYHLHHRRRGTGNGQF